MSECNILFLPHKRKITVAKGENLIRAAMEAGVHVNASCGGEGVCGKCRVVIEEGVVDGGISEKLTAEDIANGYRLACQAFVTEDVVVRVPVESEVDAGVLNRQATPRRTARIEEIDFAQLMENGLFVPPVEKKYLELPAPTVQDNLPDVTRLVSYLKLEHDEHRLDVDLAVIRKIPQVLRENDFKITATLVRPVREVGKTRIINVQPGDTTDRSFAIAMDIGTTTIYGQLLDLNNGTVLSQYGDFNGQISYGEDVITRIVYSEKPGGLEKLNEVVIKTVNHVIDKIVKKSKVTPDEISTITLAGNTTMTQLLLKIDPRYIRRSPYVPASTMYPPIKAFELGMEPGRSCHGPGLSGSVELCGRRYRCRRDGLGHVPQRGPDAVHGYRYQRGDRDRQQRMAGLCGLFSRSGLRGRRHQAWHAGHQRRHRRFFHRSGDAGADEYYHRQRSA